MGPSIDHLALAARDARASAQLLADVLGVAAPAPDGPDGDMYNVHLDGADVLFAEPAPGVDPVTHHVAFRVDRAAFGAAVAHLTARGIAYGNDPEHPDNGETSDPLGSPGRLYFLDPDGHLFELTVGPD